MNLECKILKICNFKNQSKIESLLTIHLQVTLKLHYNYKQTKYSGKGDHCLHPAELSIVTPSEHCWSKVTQKVAAASPPIGPSFYSSRMIRVRFVTVKYKIISKIK